jgi:hypothetical protein
MKKFALIAVALLLVAAPLFASQTDPTNLSAGVYLTIDSYSTMTIGDDINITVSNGVDTGSGTTSFSCSTNFDANLAVTFNAGSMPGSWTYGLDLGAAGSGASVDVANGSYSGSVNVDVSGLSNYANAMAGETSGTVTVTLSAI